MTCGIYQIKNKTNGKSYIGSSINIEKRCKTHLQGKGSIVVKSAVKKYGEKNFELIVLEKCSKNVLIEREQYFMDILQPEYNLSKIAGRIEMTPEVRTKMSTALIGNTRTKGHKHTGKTKRKIGAAMRGNKYMLGHIHTEETRAKLSIALQGNKNTLGYKHTEATKQKMSAALKLRYAKLNINQI